MDIEALRSELETMLTALSQKEILRADGKESGGDAVAVARSVIGEGADDYAEALRTLSACLNDAVDDTGQVLADHPFVAVSAAFMLGVAVGRMSGS